MRGQAFVNRIKRLHLADRHDEKFHLYQLVGVVVDKLMRGASTAPLPGLTFKQLEAMKSFYGITVDPGPLCDVTPLKHKGRRLYAPRPRAYRRGTPIIVRSMYRAGKDRSTAALRTADEAAEAAGLAGVNRTPKVTHVALMSLGWIHVAEFRVNPYLESDYAHYR